MCVESSKDKMPAESYCTPNCDEDTTRQACTSGGGRGGGATGGKMASEMAGSPRNGSSKMSEIWPANGQTAKIWLFSSCAAIFRPFWDPAL